MKAYVKVNRLIDGTYPANSPWSIQGQAILQNYIVKKLSLMDPFLLIDNYLKRKFQVIAQGAFLKSDDKSVLANFSSCWQVMFQQIFLMLKFE